MTAGGRDRPGPEIIELGLVPGFVVFDLPGAPVAAAGTRLAPDVTVAEVALLARAMTCKFAVLGYRSARDAAPEQVRAAAGNLIAELVLDAMQHPGGPLAGACQRAAAFLRGWWGDSPGPPFAPPA